MKTMDHPEPSPSCAKGAHTDAAPSGGDDEALWDRIATYLKGGWSRSQRTEDRADCEWYALRVETQHERTVAALLAERGFPTFVPMMRELRGGEPYTGPLMPGYCFVLCEPGDFADLRDIEHVAGFVCLIREDGVAWPAAFPGKAVLRLQMDERAGLFDLTRKVKAPKYRPKKGERVQITAGDYFSFFATVLAAPSKDRRKLLIEGFDPPRHKTLDVAHMVAA